MMQAEEKARVRAETAKGLQIYIYIYTSGLSDVFCTVCSVSTSHLSLNYFHYQKAKMYNFPALKASVVGDPLRVLPTEEDISTQKFLPYLKYFLQELSLRVSLDFCKSL